VRSVLHRAEHRLDPGDGFQAGGGAVRASAAGLSLRAFREAGAAGVLRESAASGLDVWRGSERGDGLSGGVGAVDAAGVSGEERGGRHGGRPASWIIREGDLRAVVFDQETHRSADGSDPLLGVRDKSGGAGVLCAPLALAARGYFCGRGDRGVKPLLQDEGAASREPYRERRAA